MIEKITLDMLSKFPPVMPSYLAERRKSKGGSERLDIDVSKKNLLDCKRVLDRHDVEYWLIYGTLLGAYRDGNFIHYDRDTDLGIFPSAIDTINQAMPDLWKEGFGLERIGKNIFTIIRDNEYIDFNLYTPEGQSYYETFDYATGEPRVIPRKHYDNRTKLTFLDKQFSIPGCTEELLEHWYGQDWQIPQNLKYAYMCDKYKLSILICHLEDREKKLAELLRILGDQARPNVEILVEKDNGEISTGAKRNKLLEKAKGDYVCFIDDDDIVPEYYIDEILTAVKVNPDCVGFNGVLKYPNGQTKSCEYRMGRINVTQLNGGYKCGIGHLSPVKREIALKVKFPDKKILEDYEYAKGIQEYLGSEQFINRTMYIYKQK